MPANSMVTTMVVFNNKRTNRQTDQQTNRQTDKRQIRQMDGGVAVQGENPTGISCRERWRNWRMQSFTFFYTIVHITAAVGKWTTVWYNIIWNETCMMSFSWWFWSGWGCICLVMNSMIIYLDDHYDGCLKDNEDDSLYKWWPWWCLTVVSIYNWWQYV